MEGPETETVHFTVNEQIVDTALYQAQVPAGLSKSEKVEAIKRAGKREWTFIEQFSPPVDPGDPHLESIEILEDPRFSFKVVGVFTEADRPFPFVFAVSAQGTRRALARAIDKAEGWGEEEFNTDPNDNLARAAKAAGMCIASIRRVGHEDNLLSRIEEFGEESQVGAD